MLQPDRYLQFIRDSCRASRLIGYSTLLALLTTLLAPGQEPFRESSKDSAANRWFTKKIVVRRLLDDMRNPARWTAFTTGAPEVVDARAAQKTIEATPSVAEIGISREQSRNGQPSLRMRMPTRLDGPGPKNGRGWGSAGVRHTFDREDWRQFNRLSFWI